MLEISTNRNGCLPKMMPAMQFETGMIFWHWLQKIMDL